MESALRLFAKAFPLLASALFVSCVRVPEMSREEIEAARQKSSEEFFTATVSKPYRGEEFAPGFVGGVWYDSIMGDPKAFNQLVTERDGQGAFFYIVNVGSKQWIKN